MKDRAFIAEVAGISAEVVRPSAVSAVAGTGIGASAAYDQSGQPIFAITIRHGDGTILTAILDEEQVDRLAHMMADFTEALPAIRSEARH